MIAAVAWQLTEEIFTHAPDSLPSGELVVMLAVAGLARYPARTWTGPQAEIARRARLTGDGARKAMGRLAGRGLELRVAISTDRRGAPVFAVPGRSPTFRVPVFASDDCECPTCVAIAGRAALKAGPAAHLSSAEGGTSGPPRDDEGGTVVPAAGTVVPGRRAAGPGSRDCGPTLSKPGLLSAAAAAAAAAAPRETDDERAAREIARRLGAAASDGRRAWAALVGARRRPIDQPIAFLRSLTDDELGEHLAEGARRAAEIEHAEIEAAEAERQHAAEAARALVAKCPSCDAPPGAPCVDPNSREPHRTHSARLKRSERVA